MRRYLSLFAGFLILAVAMVAALMLSGQWSRWSGYVIPGWVTAALAGVMGMLAGWAVLPAWWRGVLLAAPLVIWGGLQLHPGWFLAAAVVLILFQYNAIRHRVPLYRSGREVIDALARRLEEDGVTRLVDIGCGDGHVVAALARRFPDRRFTGFETAPLLYLVARWRCRHLENCGIHFRDFWNIPWRDFDAVYAFLSPEPMLRVWRKVQRELPEWGKLYSLSFEVPGIEPDALHGAGPFDLLCYRKLAGRSTAVNDLAE
ncbi:methyltransferase domain-containing protein [Guyparkeria sp. 1SP6A2]|nr:methyltransferase domain-containing protein [Guyparkeria sp. 1SP6A2]